MGLVTDLEQARRARIDERLERHRDIAADPGLRGMTYWECSDCPQHIHTADEAREHDERYHPIPTVEDTIKGLNSAWLALRLDLENAYSRWLLEYDARDHYPRSVYLEYVDFSDPHPQAVFQSQTTLGHSVVVMLSELMPFVDRSE